MKGPDPSCGAWSAEAVCGVLTAAFRTQPGLSVRSVWPRPPVVSLGARSIELDWGERFLARDREGWLFLRTRAQCLAAGESVLGRVRANDWARTNFERGWKRAAETIARGLNAHGADQQ